MRVKHSFLFPRPGPRRQPNLFLWSDHTSIDNGQPYGTMIAQAGSGVTAANLTLNDGTVVTATVQNG